MAIALDKVPAEYATVLTQVKITQIINLTMVHLKPAMKTQWWLLIKKSVTKGSEFSLSVFNVTCYKCGENGHKANEYPNKISTGKGREKGKFKKFLGKCNNFNKIGLKAADCWGLKRNKDKKPSEYKTVGEKKLSSGNDYCSGTELLLMAVDGNYEFGFMTLSDDMNFASDTLILREPNIFIYDTGATSDTTPFLNGLTNVGEASK